MQKNHLHKKSAKKPKHFYCRHGNMIQGRANYIPQPS